jgi:hypothetical protein
MLVLSTRPSHRIEERTCPTATGMGLCEREPDNDWVANQIGVFALKSLAGSIVELQTAQGICLQSSVAVVH